MSDVCPFCPFVAPLQAAIPGRRFLQESLHDGFGGFVKGSPVLLRLLPLSHPLHSKQYTALSAGLCYGCLSHMSRRCPIPVENVSSTSGAPNQSSP